MPTARRPRRPTPPGATRYHAGRQRFLPDTGGPHSTALPGPAKESGVRVVGLVQHEGGEGERGSSALSSAHLAGVGLAWSSLPGPTCPPGSPQPSGQTSKREPQTRLQDRRGGARGSRLRGGRGSPPSKVLHQPPHVRSEGGSRSSPRGCASPHPPPASAPPAARLPAPSLVQQRPPSRAAPRGAEWSRAAARAASPV